MGFQVHLISRIQRNNFICLTHTRKEFLFLLGKWLVLWVTVLLCLIQIHSLKLWLNTIAAATNSIREGGKMTKNHLLTNIKHLIACCNQLVYCVCVFLFGWFSSVSQLAILFYSELNCTSQSLQYINYFRKHYSDVIFHLYDLSDIPLILKGNIFTRIYMNLY